MKPSSGDAAIRELFEVRSKMTKKTKTGKEYVDLTIGTAERSMNCKVWSDTLARCDNGYNVGDVVEISGRYDMFNGTLQLIADDIRKVDPAGMDMSKLVQCTPFDAEQLMYELYEVADRLSPRDLRQLARKVLAENTVSLQTLPAARMVHHAYRGGLIEHIWSVVNITAALLAQLKGTTMSKTELVINNNLALAGAMLHDIGKIYEIDERNERTSEGILIGHIVSGVHIIRKAGQELGCFESGWFRELEHIILSHHGQYEFGAPVKPVTREAFIVHIADNLDSKLKIMNESLKDADATGFTPYNKFLGGQVYANVLL